MKTKAKKTIICLFLTTLISSCALKETDYAKQSNEFKNEQTVILYESSDERWSIVTSGKISFDYDVFGKKLKTNTFTTLGVDF